MLSGTLETIDGRRALRFERHLPHSPVRVWRAVTEPAELASWFVATPPWTPALDETFEAGGQSGRVTNLDPPRSIAWDWRKERLFGLRPGDGRPERHVAAARPGAARPPRRSGLAASSRRVRQPQRPVGRAVTAQRAVIVADVKRSRSKELRGLAGIANPW